MYDVSGRAWNERLLKTLEIDKNLLPEIQRSYEVRGSLRPELARALQWEPVDVVAGGADNAVSALGVGACEPGDCMISIGTSGTVAGVTEETAPDRSGSLHFFNHVIPGRSYYMGVMLSAALSLNWFKAKMGAGLSWSEVESGIAKIPAGACGMLWLPYLQGERTPHRNPNARGVLYGMSAMSDEMSVFRAVMEGITYGLRDSFELLKSMTAIRRVLVVGGGAKNKVWRKMLADNMKVQVTAPAVDEGGAYGAAMLAAMGGGADLATVRGWVRETESVEPDEANAERYDVIYGQFRALYRDLRARFDVTAAL
jgi:xylulokinase